MDRQAQIGGRMKTSDLSELEVRELKEALEEFLAELDGNEDVAWMFTSLDRLRLAAAALGVETNVEE